MRRKVHLLTQIENGLPLAKSSAFFLPVKRKNHKASPKSSLNLWPAVFLRLAVLLRGKELSANERQEPFFRNDVLIHFVQIF
ncbi:MAG: hypothetical protein C6W58_11395 [Bacillaceae bacterium]|nr:MAG: hypothetical protein C6W58_11395 [Bacillaceae bacterium]